MAEKKGVFDRPQDKAAGELVPYGNPISAEAAAEAFGKGRGSIPVDVIVTRSEELPANRRGVPVVRSVDFFSSIVKAPDGRYFFSGVLNGWPGFVLLELVYLTALVLGEDGNPVKTSKLIWKRKAKRRGSIMTMFKKEDGELDLPAFPEDIEDESIRAVMYLPKYKDLGYTPNNPGHVWCYFSRLGDFQHQKFAHGANIIEAVDINDRELHGSLPFAVRAAHLGHRYAKQVESELDKKLYHSAIFIEWDHGEYGTMVELAWLNGIGGYKGRSNWAEDKDRKPESNLARILPDALVAPYMTHKSEIRVLDVPMKDIAELENYLQKYTGPDERFLDPGVKEVEPILLKRATKPKICELLVNRIFNNPDYSAGSLEKGDTGLNCQTFSASFLSVLTNKEIELYSSKPDNVLKSNEKREWYTKSFRNGKNITLEYD